MVFMLCSSFLFCLILSCITVSLSMPADLTDQLEQVHPEIQAAGDPVGPLTQNFQDWLKNNGYEKDNFARLDMGNHGSFGGKTSDSDKLVNVPVLFFHGNSDSALQANSFSTGWTNTVKYFLQNNYSYSELYGTSWGSTNTLEAFERHHDCATLTRLRKFVEAVLAYTGSSHFSVLSHSMGVTLVRKVIRGGESPDIGGKSCNLGPSLVEQCDVLVGISGANRGLCGCVGESSIAISCNQVNGLWPGVACGYDTPALCGMKNPAKNCIPTKTSKFLMDINTPGTKDATLTFSVWSSADDLLGYQDLVWGGLTSYILSSNGYLTYSNYTHMQTKELTAADQYYMITQKSIPFTRG